MSVKKLYSFVILFLGLTCNLNAQIITTFAGNGGFGNTGDGLPATAATLAVCNAVAADLAGNVYIASSNVIRKVNTAGIISTFAGTGTAGFSGDGGAATAAKLNNPTGLVADAAGNIFIADNDNQRIRKVNTSGIISTVAGNGTSGYTGDGAAATAATFSHPYGVAIDPTGVLFITDKDNHVVRQVNTSGIISTIAGTGVAGFSGDGLFATSAQLNEPAGICLTKSGLIVVADHENARLRAFIPGDRMSTIAGNFMPGYGGEYVPATSAYIDKIWGVNVDDAGNIYIPDALNYRVRKIGSSSWIYTIAGDGTNGSTGDGGSPLSARVSRTTSVAVDAHNNVYIADADNFKIRMLPCPGGPPVVTPISGSAPFCQTAFITLTNSTTGGGWYSSDPSIATVGVLTGKVTGVAGGTATITYTVTNGCGNTSVITAVTVNPLPNPGVITGKSAICTTTPATLSNAVTGGKWTSATGIATIGSSSGIVTGVAPGVTTISYAVTNACGTTYATHTLSVSSVAPTVGAISGSSTTCVYMGNTLTNPTSGGVWSSSNTTVAYAGVGGLVAGVAPGTATISYSIINGCGSAIATKAVTVPTFYVGENFISTVAGTGISGHSGDDGMGTGAKIRGAGYMTRDRAGNTYFTDPNSWAIRKLNTAGVITTVGATTYYPAGIAVDTMGNIYVGENAPFPTSLYGITKISPAGISSPFVPATSGLGTIEGLGIDKAGNIYFSNPGNLRVMKVTPAGVMSLFAGKGTTGYSGDGGPATAAELNNPNGLVVDATGNVYFADNGNAVIRKVNTSGIISTVAGNNVSSYSGDGGPATAASLYRPTDVAVDTVGNMYISDMYVIRKVNSAGIITTWGGGVSSYIYAGDDVPATTAPMANTGIVADKIGNLYLADGYNYRVRKIAISTIGKVTGADTVCVSATTPLTHSGIPTGGTWGSTNTTIATVTSAGVVKGVSKGSVMVYYSVTNTCGSGYAVKDIYVNDILKPTITGTATVCKSATTTLSASDAGGTWTSSDITVATVVSTGDVTGVKKGTAVITYSLANSCGIGRAMQTVTVNDIPATPTITGPATVCQGTTISLTGAAPGGTWDSDNLSVASVSSSGIVTGVNGGSANISYTLTNSCGWSLVVKPVTVLTKPTVSSITGATTVCETQTMTLSNSTPGGVWASAVPSVASVDAAGTVTGIAPGIGGIDYSVTNTCGTTTISKSITVDPMPNAGTIDGPATICVGSTKLFSQTVTGGIWGTDNSAIATIGATGDATGISAGTVNITYQVSAGVCINHATYPITINDCPDYTGVHNTAGFAGQFIISPNPNNGNFSLLLTSASTENVHIIITDIVGRVVAEANTTTNIPIQLGLNQPAGVYLVSALTNNLKITTKIVVKE